MKLYSNPFVLEILKSRDSSDIHKKPNVLMNQVLKYKDEAIKLWVEAYKIAGLSIAKYYSSQVEAYKTARKIKKNIHELKDLSDHILNDVGISKDEISELLNSAIDQNVIRSEYKIPQNLHSLKRIKINRQAVNNQKIIVARQCELKKCG